MNELLQEHGCSNVFTVPNGLRELMSDITREVLRWQPAKLYDFIANYLSALLITREHGIMAVKILDDLCDCRPSVSEHLLRVGVEQDVVEMIANIIKAEIETLGPEEGKEKVRETAILKKILVRFPMDEELSAKVCQVARNAYRDYWYRKNMLLKGMSENPEKPWEKAARHTLEIYKKTKPSISEIHRATERIQAAYRGYHVRRNVLSHLEPKERKAKPDRKVGLPGPPLDIAGSREINLGPVIKIKPHEDDVNRMFADEAGQKLGLRYDPMMTITHVDDDQYLEENTEKKRIQIGETPQHRGIKTPQFSVMEAAITQTGPTHMHAQGGSRIKEQIKPARDIDASFISSYQRISFAEDPPHIIIDYDNEEIPEEPGIYDVHEERPVSPPRPFEIPEELPVTPQSAHSTDDEDAVDDAEY